MPSDGVPSTRKILNSSSISQSPGNMGFFVTISTRIVPMAHMSIGGAYVCDPSRISGGRYHSVTTSCVSGRIGGQNARARPKSAIFRRPSFVTRRFCGLRSRCMMPRMWQKARPRIICSVYDLMSIGSRGPSFESRNRLRSLSRNSKMRYNRPSFWRTSRSVTMFGCVSSLSSEISRSAVLGMPSSSSSSRIFFIATKSPVMRSLPL
mmetsp:Transcript_15321/g.51533  ORF Transcript_15321/g.51533 Transcript_15321/m.51533 type:complete len:207 (+) Transcript_15321:359-979(+)